MPDAWYDPDSVKTGYEISFTRYFYKPQPLRTLEEIRADILALEKETEGLLGEIIGCGTHGPNEACLCMGRSCPMLKAAFIYGGGDQPW